MATAAEIIASMTQAAETAAGHPVQMRLAQPLDTDDTRYAGLYVERAGSRSRWFVVCGTATAVGEPQAFMSKMDATVTYQQLCRAQSKDQEVPCGG